MPISPQSQSRRRKNFVPKHPPKDTEERLRTFPDPPLRLYLICADYNSGTLERGFEEFPAHRVSLESRARHEKWRLEEIGAFGNTHIDHLLALGPFGLRAAEEINCSKIRRVLVWQLGGIERSLAG